VLCTWALNFVDQGRFVEAEKALTTAIHRNPTYADAYVLRGFVRSEIATQSNRVLGPVNPAIQDLDHAVSIAPRNPMCYRVRGEVRYAMVDRKGATDDFRMAIQLDSTDAVAHYGLAELCAEAGKRDSAVLHYAAALRHPSLMDSTQIGHARERHASLVSGEIRIDGGSSR